MYLCIIELDNGILIAMVNVILDTIGDEKHDVVDIIFVFTPIPVYIDI